MSSKRETVTITTLKNGIMFDYKTSKIKVVRCDECGIIIPDEVSHTCKICHKDMCKDHQIEAPYLKTDYDNGSGIICNVCQTTFSDELNQIKMASEAAHAAWKAHHQCGETWSALYNTLHEHVIKSSKKWREYPDNKIKEVTTVITTKGDVEINRTEETDEFYVCGDCGKNIGHYHSFNQCEICGKDLCKDHSIKTPFLGGRQICPECDRDFSEEILNIKTANQATHEALITLTKTNKVYSNLLLLLSKGR